MAFDFWTILREKAGVVHTETQREVLGFRVNVFPEKAVHLAFSTLSSAPRWPLASRLGHRPQPHAPAVTLKRSRLDLEGLIFADVGAHSYRLLLLGEGGLGVTEEKLASLSLPAGFLLAPLS